MNQMYPYQMTLLEKQMLHKIWGIRKKDIILYLQMRIFARRVGVETLNQQVGKKEKGTQYSIFCDWKHYGVIKARAVSNRRTQLESFIIKNQI